jgi:hypothetical protein
LTHDPNLPPYDPARERIQWYYGGLPIPGPGGIILLAILYLILLLSVVAAISAAIAGPILRVIGKLYEWDNPPGWGYAFTAAFMGFFAFFLVAVFQVEAGGRDMYHTTALPLTPEWFDFVLNVYTLPLLACGAVMWWRMQGEYAVFAGVFGFVRAVLVGALCFWISSQIIAASAGRVVEGANETQEGFIAGLLGLSMLGAFVAVVGGVFATLPLFAGARLLARGSAPRPGLGRIFVTAVLVVLTWLGASMALELCFNALDKPYFYFKDPSVAASLNVSPFLYLLPFGLGFLLCQLTAVGLSGALVASRLKPRFEGRGGWLRASFIAFFAIAAAVVPFTLLIIAMIASGEFKEIFQYF